MSAALATTEDFPVGHGRLDAQTSPANGENYSEQAKQETAPMAGPPARSNLPAGQEAPDAHIKCVGGDLNCGSGHPPPDTHRGTAAAAPTSPDPTIVPAAPRMSPSGPGTHAPEPTTKQPAPMTRSSVRAFPPPASATVVATPIAGAPVLAETDSPRGSTTFRSTPNESTSSLADPLLALAADVLDDLERVRIANENRLRQLTRTEEDSDGLERGFGLPVDHPDVKRLASLVEGLATAEHQAELNLRRQLRQHPLGPWVKQARGVGEKQAARLLASIGDPYINTLHNRPRTVSELWAYAGYHVLPAGQGLFVAQQRDASGALTGGNPDHQPRDAQSVLVGVAATRARGQRANWSATAKMRAHLVAVSIVKAGGPYRETYDKARAKYDGALHQAECKRCGPSGKPAPAGSPLSAGHQHARALRAVAKEILRDLWREAKRLHEEAAS